MLSWLKFFPFSKAQETRPIPDEIRGPYFSKFRENKWCFGDNLFYFDAPRANPILGFDGLGRTVSALKPNSRSNILTAHLKQVFSSNPGVPPSEWNNKLFYSNTWYFVGPWFTGMEARLRSTGLLISVSNGSQFKELNLFHPRIFESAISSYLDTNYGYRRSGKKPDCRGPLNWRVLKLSSGIQAVVCDIHDITGGTKDNPLLERLVLFPVTTQCFVEVIFNFGGVEIYRDEVRSKPLLSLADSIINSMRLNVGPFTQDEWDKVKETCPDMSITETFGELPWPLFKEKASKKRKETDITPTDIPQVLPSK